MGGVIIFDMHREFYFLEGEKWFSILLILP